MYRLGPPEERSPVPRFARVVFFILIAGIIVLIILIGIKPPDSSTRAGAFEFVIATQVFKSGEDIVVGVNNAVFYLPGDAVSLAGSITIFSREPNLFPNPGDTRWVRPLVVNVEFRDGQGKPVPNVTFAKPAEICFKITPQRWEDYLKHPDEYGVHSYSEGSATPQWEPLTMVTHADRFQLCGQTDHLSLFALATKPETKIPLVEPTVTPNPTQPGSTNPSNNRSGDVYAP